MKIVNILFLLVCFYQTSYAQNEHKNGIYVGNVISITRDKFISEYNIYRKADDSLLDIAPIMKSKYNIEIRLYESKCCSGLKSCTTLFFDTAFHISRKSKVYNGWEEQNHAEYYFPLNSIKPDSVFFEMVRNGIFELPEKSRINHRSLTLINDSLSVQNKLCTATDGDSYAIQIKLSNRYKYIYHSQFDEAKLHCYPDNIDLERKRNIVNLIRPNAHLVKNK